MIVLALTTDSSTARRSSGRPTSARIPLRSNPRADSVMSASGSSWGTPSRSSPETRNESALRPIAKPKPTKARAAPPTRKPSMLAACCVDWNRTSASSRVSSSGAYSGTAAALVASYTDVGTEARKTSAEQRPRRQVGHEQEQDQDGPQEVGADQQPSGWDLRRPSDQQGREEVGQVQGRQAGRCREGEPGVARRAAPRYRAGRSSRPSR